jgi:hypothetical protein
VSPLDGERWARSYSEIIDISVAWLYYFDAGG